MMRQQRGLQVIGVHAAVGRVQTILVGATKGKAMFDAGAGRPR